MNKLYLLEKILTGKKVKFIEGVITLGPKKDNRIMILHDLERNKKFVIQASLNNFVKFKRWKDKEATADYEPHLQIVPTDHGKLATVTLSTEVEIEDYKEKNPFDNFDF